MKSIKNKFHFWQRDSHQNKILEIVYCEYCDEQVTKKTEDRHKTCQKHVDNVNKQHNIFKVYYETLIPLGSNVVKSWY